tara:strand:- start:77 stop:403 length:327 start_codon:yes stop_codon:yes gene_type:complete
MAGIGKKYPKIEWQNANFKWDVSPDNSTYPKYTWDEVELIQHAAGDDWSKWEDNDKKKLVKLILKVHGNTITESKQKEIKQYKIKVSDIKLTVEKILGVEVITENINF